MLAGLLVVTAIGGGTVLYWPDIENFIAPRGIAIPPAQPASVPEPVAPAPVVVAAEPEPEAVVAEPAVVESDAVEPGAVEPAVVVVQPEVVEAAPAVVEPQQIDAIERTVSIIVDQSGRHEVPASMDSDTTVPLTGSPEEIAAGLQAFADEGIRHIQIYLVPNTLETIELFRKVLEAMER